MAINKDVEEIKVKEGIGILGNTECIQCGACCYEWNEFLYQTGTKETEQCENFAIKDGKAYCLAHDNRRKHICSFYFCGNTDFIFRFRYGGDEKLRKIAEMLGTAPASYKIPKLLPKNIEERTLPLLIH